MISEGPVKQTLKTSIILKQVNYPRLQGTVDFGSNFVSGYLSLSAGVRKEKKSLN